MGGKVFSDSSNLQEDKARILFDYYKKAAQKIVAEERAIEEKDVAAKGEAEAKTVLAKKKNILKVVFFVLIVPALAFFGFMMLPLFKGADFDPVKFGIGIVPSLVFLGLGVKAHVDKKHFLEEVERQNEIRRERWHKKRLQSL